ncbi:hypothetical protein [Winogradskya consettensis]|uniref:Sulfotransferase family protein n=1 Tax=Winogradskya consettensis TaxID=113560 RepID=A0A919SZA5_9ACTN|nr:hypothetical protein [Actinoplanes consettensis]GIM80151.1 hypothetical protein Aco04nite_69250 [Actinoplanes consettensis]
MVGRVFLHIGAPKTGSTYVQTVLWRNRDVLRTAGVLLPGSSLAHDQAMTDLRQVSWRDPAATWTWDRLVAETAGWSGDVIITNEGLGGATAAQAARAVESLQPAEVHIVVAGRDLWRTFPSVWQQGIRSRNIGSFSGFLDTIERGGNDAFWDHMPNRMLRRWGDLVPAAHRHLVTVPPPGSPHDLLWRRFAYVMAIPDGLCELEAPSANASLGAAEIEVLRRVNAALGDRYPHRSPYQRVVQRHLVDAVLKQRTGGLRFGVGLDRADWVLGLAEQQIEELRNYPCDVLGDLDELRPADLNPAPTPDELGTTQILDAAIETIIGMLAHAETLDQPTETLKNRVRRGLRLDR